MRIYFCLKASTIYVGHNLKIIMINLNIKDFINEQFKNIYICYIWAIINKVDRLKILCRLYFLSSLNISHKISNNLPKWELFFKTLNAPNGFEIMVIQI